MIPFVPHLSARVQSFVDGVASEHLHQKRVLSLANAALGCLTSASLCIHDMGRGLAEICGLDPKHATKQIDRLLSNPGINVEEFLAYWVPFLVSRRTAIFVALDWTDFDDDGQCTLAINSITSHGRATPLMWKTVSKKELAGNQKRHEHELLEQFSRVLPGSVKATIIADRGFSDVCLLEKMSSLGFSFVVRLRKNLLVEMPDSSTCTTQDLVATNGRSRRYSGCAITSQRKHVGNLIAVKKAGMQEGWILASNDDTFTATSAVTMYARRFSIEESFRDAKDLRFGAGLSWTRIGTAARRDRLLLINALSVVLLTLLGAAGEATGLDKRFKVNTSKKRVHSLYKQGVMYLGALGTLKPERAEPLLAKFEELLTEQPYVEKILGLI